MNKIFRYEKDLVDMFAEQYSSKHQTLLIREMKIRWGNIDLVEINNMSLPFSKQQCQVLSKPSCAKIFMRLNNKKLLTKKTLFEGLGLSESTFNRALSELIKEHLIVREENKFRRNIDFVFPKVVISGYEAKLTDYSKALFQARQNKEFVDYSYMVFPMDVAENIMEKHKDTICTFNLGLIGVSPDKTKVYIKPHKNKPMKPYIRLMNLVLSSEFYDREEAAV
ncbi:MAG: hypothetical protein ACI4S2_16565 [Lachnospiraceae bacterium]